MIINVYTTNVRAFTYVKQVLMDLKRKKISKTVAVREPNIPLTSMDRPMIQKLSKQTKELTQTIEEMAKQIPSALAILQIQNKLFFPPQYMEPSPVLTIL